MNTQTDRELLEKAAKAAGYSGILNFNNEYGVMEPRGGGLSTLRPWNPLRDDGDALRLVVTLGMNVHVIVADGTFVSRYENEPVASETRGNDPFAATRRAIVRAAAEIGSAMK